MEQLNISNPTFSFIRPSALEFDVPAATEDRLNHSKIQSTNGNDGTTRKDLKTLYFTLYSTETLTNY